MSYIPSHAMPHAYAHDEDDDAERKRQEAGAQATTALKIGGAALVGYLIYRALR